MSVPISTSSTSSTSYTQARNTTASDNINNIAKDSLNKGGKFNNRNVCKVCAKVFTQKYSLNRHMQTHSHNQARIATASNSINDVADGSLNKGCQFNNRNVCEVCNKRFTHKRSLNAHMRIHTGEKSYLCTECGKLFAWNNVLTRHMQTHSHNQARIATSSDNINDVSDPLLNECCQFNNRNVCKVCAKVFTKKYNLNRHMRTHTGEKPYPCTECGEAFSRKWYLKSHARRAHEVAEMFKINPSNCNNARDEMINNYYKEMQDICNSRKIKFYDTSMRQMLIALKENTEILQKPEKLDLFCHKAILFLKHMTSPNSTTTLTNMLLNGPNFYSSFNVILDMTDEQLKEIASYEHIQDISNIYQEHGMITYEKFKQYDNFLYQSNETESNIKIKSHASAIILNKLMISSESLNKLSAFFAFPIFKDDKNNYKVELVDNICKMLTIKTIPSEDELTTFLNNSHIKNNKGLFVAICNMCNNKGIPDKNQLNIFLDNRRFKNTDGTLNCSLIQKICSMYNKKGIPDENKLNIFLDNRRFKNTDSTLNCSLIQKICSMYNKKSIPDENKLNIFLDNPRFKNKDGTLKYNLINNICTMCYRYGIPNEMALNAFLNNTRFKNKDGTLNYDLIHEICSICNNKGIPNEIELNDFLTTIFACKFITVEDNFILIKLLVTLTYGKGIPKKTLITDFISWLTEKKQIDYNDYKLMQNLLYNNAYKKRFIPSKKALEETEKKIKGILKDKNIELDTEFGLDNFNIKILSLYQIFKSDIGNTLTEFIKFYPKNSDLYLDNFIKILATNNLDNLNKVLDLIKTPEFADKFNNLAYKNKIIELLQINNISYSLIKEAITELPLEDIVDYVLITIKSSRKINRQEFAYLRQCRNILLQQNFPQIVVNIYFKIITRFNQDDIEKYSKAENFQIITNNMSIKCLNLLTKNVSISEIRQIFNEKINYKNSNITEQTSTTMFNTALMFNERMEATAEYNHEKFELLSATENTTLIQLKNNNGEINNNIVLHDFLACIANNLNTEVDYTYDNKNKTLVIENVFKKKSFIAPQLKITKTGVIITNWSLAQTNEFFNFINAKDENDAIKNRLYQEEIALGKRKRSATGELSPKRQRTDNQAEISLDVIINMMKKEMFITDSLWKTIYDYKDKLNNTCIQLLANRYKSYLSESCNSDLSTDYNDYFVKTMEFIQEKIYDNKLNMELEAIKSVIVNESLLDQELDNSIAKLNHKDKSKDRTFFEEISAESLALKQANVEATQRKFFAEKIINYIKAQNSKIFNSTEMQLLDILKEYKDFVSVEIITNYIIDRILICNTDSTNEWQQIIKEKAVIEDSLDTFENPFVDDDFNPREETLDELLSQMPFIENNKDTLSNDKEDASYSRTQEETQEQLKDISFDDLMDI